MSADLGLGAVTDPSLRVRLVPPRPDVLAAAAGWMPGALAEIGGSKADGVDAAAPAAWTGSASAGSTPALVLVAGAPVGLLRFALAGDLLVIDQLVVAAGHRNLGYGAEAVYALEAGAAGVRRAQALVPPGNGLAIYFWLRAGYRPLFASLHGRGRVTVMERVLV